RVNAIVTTAFDRAMADAARADEAMARGTPLGPLHGLPIAHKDLVETQGIRTTRGSPFYRDYVRQDQHAGVRRRITHVQHDLRGDAEPVRHGKDVWRQQRWRGRCAGVG